MTHPDRVRRRAFAGALGAAALGIFALPTPAVSQMNAIHKSTLQERQFPPPKYHTVTIRTVVDPNGLVPRHIHPGIEMGYILDGQATLTVQGQPVRSLSTGDSFSIPPYTPHSVRNTGPGPLTMLSTYVVDKSKPILILDPEPAGAASRGR